MTTEQEFAAHIKGFDKKFKDVDGMVGRLKKTKVLEKEYEAHDRREPESGSR